ncbi:zinc finger protein 724-like isoform X2 [Hoplias malabaricus]
MEECIQSISQPQQLRHLFKYQTPASEDMKEKPKSWSTTPDDCILSCLASPQLVQIVTEEQAHTDNQSESGLDYPPSYCQEVQVESVVIAQYIENDMGSRSSICEENVAVIDCFDADENKVYELQSLDQVDTENATEVYEELESVELRAVDFVLDACSEKQDTSKSEVNVINSREENLDCQENDRMTCSVETESFDDRKMTEKHTSNETTYSLDSADVNTILDIIQEEPKELSDLVNSCLVKQPCVKLDRFDTNNKTFPHPLPPKMGLGQARKDTQNTEPCVEVKQDVPDACAFTDKPSEIQNVVSNVLQKLKTTYTETKGSLVLYACTLCQFQDSKEIQLQHHFIVDHPKEYKQLCEAEEEKTTNFSTPHHSKSQEPLAKMRLYRGVPVCKTCPICRKTFTRSSDMRRHQTSHTVARPFACLSCGKNFRYSFDLRRHQQHACAKQGYVVLEQSMMDEESASDATTTCHKNMLLSSPLEQKSPNKHNTVICHVCGKSQSDVSCLENHMETHSKACHHTCPCGISYKFSENTRTQQHVCPESHLCKPEQKKCNEQTLLEDSAEVMLDSEESHSQRLPHPENENLEATGNSSSVLVTDSDSKVQKPQIVKVSVRPNTDSPKATHSSGSVLVGSDTKRHLRTTLTIHPHKCTQCGNSFKYSYNLKKHEDVCEGQKKSEVAGQLHSRELSESSKVASNCRTVNATGIPLDPSLRNTSYRSNLKEEASEWQKDKTEYLKSSPSETVFSCDRCEKKCKDLPSLEKHMITCENKAQRFKCVKCGVLFRTLFEVRKHVQTHWGEDPLQCSLCGKCFQNSSELSEHKLVHKRDCSYSCTMCLESFKGIDSLRQHYSEIHEVDGPYQCSHCDKTDKDLGSMIVHIRTHNDEHVYQCPHCLKRFKHRSALNVHEKIHSGNRPFLCEECGKSFSTNVQLQRHYISHSNDRPYTCSECKKCFKSQHALRGHFLKHSKSANIPCEFCGKMFSQASALNRHHRTHTGERPYSCPKCDKTFLTSGEVRKHLRYHNGERPFQCTLCSKTFTQTCYLTAHMRIHTGERPYVCSVCAKAFVCNTHLKRHLFVHTKEKPFKCDCGKAFNRTNLLKVHQKSQCVLLKK